MTQGPVWKLSGALPDDSLARLTTLARLSLGGAAAASGTTRRDVSGLRVVLLARPGPLPDAVVTCADAAQSGAPLPAAVAGAMAESGAFVLLPLRDDQGVPVLSPGEEADECALYVACPSPGEWTSAEVAGLAAVAATAAAELRLRTAAREAARVAEELRANPLRDPLTAVANRELFMDRVGMTLLRCARFQDTHFAVLSIALEQLPNIEASFGFETGQEVLREVAVRLRTVLRNYDSVARLSEDEFGILLDSMSDDTDAARVAHRVHDALRTPIITEWDQFMVSANIGIVSSTSGVDSPARLLQLATLARARARMSGNPYEMFDPGMQQHARARLHAESELRGAVEAHQFELHYQPIVSLPTGRIVHVEGLLRWRHPQRGLVTASEFISLAEETGLVGPLSASALTAGGRQVHEWRRQLGTRSLALSINVTAPQLHQASLLEQVSATVREFDLANGGLNLEITERMLIGDPQQIKATLNHLRSLGVGIHLDDFGIGYSSLHLLHELPLDAIKIDRTFTSGIATGARDAQVMTTIRELARQLGVPVIAEGVETREQLAVVRALGCEFAQGYYFARPQPPAETAALLAQNPEW